MIVNSTSCNHPADAILNKHLASLEQALLAWLETFRQRGMSARPSSDGIEIDHLQSLKASNATSSDTLFGLSCEMLCRVCLLLISRGHLQLDQHDSTSRLDDHHHHGVAIERAEQLRQTTIGLAEIAERPVCRALALRAPLHFLDDWYRAAEDLSGLKWCLELRNSVQKKAPYLNWNAVLPWSLISLVKVPV